MRKQILFLAILMALPILCHSHDELSEQVQAITVHIQREPNNPELYFQRGELLRADSHWRLAELDYLKVKKLDPKMDSADLGLGLVYLQMKKYKQAKQALDRFLLKQPDHAPALVARGHALSKLGNRTAAIEEYTRGLELHPDPEIYIERSQLLLEENRIQDALASLNQGMERLGPIVTMELYAVELELKLKHFDEALARVDKIADQSERKEMWFAKKGEILLLASRKDEARAMYLSAQQALQTLPAFRRHNRYTQELEKSIHTALEKLGENPVE